jgi:TolB-like protein
MNKLFAELRRRNMFRVAGVYAVVSWVLAQASGVLEDALGLPPWFDTLVVSLLLIGFPIALLLAWAFEMTPEGVKRTETVAEGESVTAKTGRMLDYVIVGGLVLVAAMVVWQGTRFAPAPLIVAKDAAPQGEVSSGDNVQPHPQLVEGSKANINTGPSIAVLPFEDFSSGKDQKYFADGMSEELLNVLARIKGLRVASRTSAFAFKGREASISEIAKALDVGHVLEGSIRKAGSTLRITAQLINTKTDEHMWSETYDRPLTAENIFAIQDEIAAAIVGELKGQLSLSATQESDRTASLEAYELYIRARDQAQKRLPDTLNAAIEGYKQVIALDPEFAPAYAGLAVTYLLMPEYTTMSEKEGIRLAKPFVDRALELAPNSAEALTAAASLAMDEGKSQAGLDFTNRAIAANPNYVLAYHRQGLAYGGLGQPEKALASFEKALQLDPLSAVLLANLSAYQLRLGDIAAAQVTDEKNIKFNPDSVHGYAGLGVIKYDIGDYAGAHTLFKDAQAINPESTAVISQLWGIYVDVGLFDLAEPMDQTPSSRGILSVMRGDHESARKIVAENPDTASYTAFLLGDTAAAYTEWRKQASQINLLALPVTPTLAVNMTFIAMVFQAQSDPDGQILLDKLGVYFAGKTPTDFTNGGVLFGAGLLSIANGQTEQALPWFERMADVGYAWAGVENVQIPGIDELRQYPKWQEIEKRFNENAAEHRAAIEAQLANPKPNWVK